MSEYLESAESTVPTIEPVEVPVVEPVEKSTVVPAIPVVYPTSRSISVKEESRDDSIEVISTSHMSPRKHAYYRMNVHLRVA